MISHIKQNSLLAPQCVLYFDTYSLQTSLYATANDSLLRVFCSS
jgi:hypothetical protein